MEEHILRIIKEYWGSSQEGAARATTSMVLEFIEWWIFEQHPFISWVDEEGRFITDEYNPKRWTIDELFEYWINNIRKL